MEFFEVNIEIIRNELKANKTYKEISNLFKTNFPEVRRGFSERNVRLFCAKRGIGRMTETEVDAILHECMTEVGPTYGRKMMTGYIRSKGVNLTGRQVSRPASPELRPFGNKIGNNRYNSLFAIK